jgi:hypothetical protein
MEYDDRKIEQIWNQKDIPVIHRRTGSRQKHRVRLPFAEDNRIWVNQAGKSEASWSRTDKCWLTPKSWFDSLVERSLDRYGRIYIVQPYNQMEKCAPACMNATGFECQCSCMGANHGAGNDGSWFEVEEAFAFRWRGSELACRLLRR